MDLLNMVLDTVTGTSAQTKGGYSTLILILVMIAVMYFVTIRPQKKRQKEEQQLRENLQIGDEITTIGGIVGKIITVKEDSIVIETGADRIKMKVMRWAVQTNNTANEKLQAEREAAKKAKEEAKNKGKIAGGDKKEKSFAEEEAEKEKENNTD